MPQFLDTETVTPVTVTALERKPVVVVCKTNTEMIKSLMEKGFACLDPGFTAPWARMENMMDKLDEGTIEKINSFYNEKKIIKSFAGATTKQNIDRKVAFDISPDRVAALTESGMMERFPEFPDMMDYFSQCQDWLTHLMLEVGETCSKDKMKFNFRMISYNGETGSCQPHRDFGLVTLIQQNGVAGLKVEQEGELVEIPGDCSLLLAGWCLHLTSNGQIPAPLHQVTRPAARRLSCVSFLAPDKDLLLEGGSSPLYRSIRAGELKMMMAKRWRVREGTLQSAGDDQQTSQDDFVFKNLKI